MINPGVLHKINSESDFNEAKSLLFADSRFTHYLLIFEKDSFLTLIDLTPGTMTIGEVNFYLLYQFYTFNGLLIQVAHQYNRILGDKSKLNELQVLLSQFYGGGDLSFKHITDVMRIQYEINK